MVGDLHAVPVVGQAVQHSVAHGVDDEDREPIGPERHASGWRREPELDRTLDRERHGERGRELARPRAG